MATKKTRGAPKGSKNSFKLTAKILTLFITQIREGVGPYKASEICGVDYQSVRRVYNAQSERGAAFHKAWDDAVEAFNDDLEKEVYRRGVRGVKRPIVQGGRVVTHPDSEGKEQPLIETTYSDRLLEFYMKRRMPDRYGDQVRIEASGSTGVLVVPRPLTSEEWNKKYPSDDKET